MPLRVVSSARRPKFSTTTTKLGILYSYFVPVSLLTAVLHTRVRTHVAVVVEVVVVLIVRVQ